MSAVYGKELFNRFCFDDHRVVYQQVETIAPVKLQALILNRNMLLADHELTGSFEFVNEAPAIDAFEKARAEALVNLDSELED